MSRPPSSAPLPTPSSLAEVAGVATSPPRVGPPPAPPPDRLTTWLVLDLLATTRRWRVHEPFICGQADGLSRVLVGCLNAGSPAPRWLRMALVTYLLEALWERPQPGGPASSAQALSWRDARDELVARWRDPAGRYRSSENLLENSASSNPGSKGAGFQNII